MGKSDVFQKLLRSLEKNAGKETEIVASKLKRFNPAEEASRQKSLQSGYDDVFDSLPAAEKSAADSARVMQEGLPNFEMVGSPKTPIPSGSGNVPAVRGSTLPSEAEQFKLVGKPYNPDTTLPAIRGDRSAVGEIPPYIDAKYTKDVSPIDSKDSMSWLKSLGIAGGAATGLGLGAYAMSGNDSDDEQPQAMQQAAEVAPEQPKPESQAPAPSQSAASKLAGYSKPTGGASSPSQPQSGMMDLDLGQGQDYSQQLLDAQALQASGTLAGQLGKAGELIASGISGYKPQGTSLFDANIAQSGQGVKNLEQRVAMEKYDKNSPLSKAFKQFSSKLGVNIKGDLSADQAEKVMPYIYKAFEAEESRRTKKEDRAESRTARTHEKEIAFGNKQKEKNETLTRDFRKELVSGEVGKLYSAYVKSDQSVKRMEDAIKSPSGYKDLANIYSFIKPLDSDSAVREGELALGLKVGSVPEKMRAKFKSFLTGEMFDPNQRKSMLDTIKVYATQNREAYLDAARPVIDQAERMGLDSDEIVRLPKNHEDIPSNKKITRKAYNSKTNQTQLIYEDGTKETVEGQK